MAFYYKQEKVQSHQMSIKMINHDLSNVEKNYSDCDIIAHVDVLKVDNEERNAKLDHKKCLTTVT